MMKYQVRLTLQAKEDLQSIYDYIAEELCVPQTAEKQIRRLQQSILALDQMPERYHVYEQEPWRSRKVRIMPVDRYLVFYAVDLTEAMVTVIRVLYGGRDLQTQLS